MIKVGIIGAHKPDAGELLRLLVYHPEVDIITLFAPAYSGRPVSSCHHGFIGERIIGFSDSINVEKLDAVFITDDSSFGREIIENASDEKDLRVIDLSPDRFKRWRPTDMEYGLSEINRKPLVRGSRMAIIPSPVAALALISLYPLALQLLLPERIDINVAAPEDIIATIDTNMVCEEISRQLKTAQNSFSGNINIRLDQSGKGRAMRVSITMPCELSISEIDRIYEGIYDDHNFSFTSLAKVGNEEVEGTQKCIISFCKPGAGLIEVETLGDCRMRGGAGDAVHVLNLLFALQEKVGLCLKPSSYGEYDVNGSRNPSWFA